MNIQYKKMRGQLCILLKNKKTEMKRISILFIALLFSNSFYAQTIKEFDKDPVKFVAQMNDFLNITKRDDCKLAGEKLINLQKSGKLSGDAMTAVINSANLLAKRNLTANPYYMEYCNALDIVYNSNKDANFIKNWTIILDQVINNQRIGDNKKFLAFLNFTNGLIKHNALFSSDFKTWYFENPNFTLSYENNDVVVKVPTTNIVGYVAGDSTIVYNTSGTYTLSDNNWDGSGGKVNWSRAGMDANNIFATFKKYRIDMSKQEFSVDTVDFVFGIFFTTPIQGSFYDKLITNSNEENATYPRFNSFDANVKINNLAENVTYVGAFNLYGYKIYGAGKNNERATLTFYLADGKTKALVAKGKDITIRKPVELNFREAEMTLYFGKDSIYHPSVNINYKIAKKELRISRGKDGLAAAKFIDSYHKTELEADALTWILDKESINMMMEEGAGQKLSYISSQNFYSDLMMRKIQGTNEYNPLSKLKIFKEKNNTDSLDAATFAKVMDPHLTAEQVLPMIYFLAQEGFIYYNKDLQIVKILPKTTAFVLAKSNKTDFDVINFGALAKSLTNPVGVINLKNYNIDFNGVRTIPIADSSQVQFFPKNDSMKLGKNRDMEFSGMVLAARLDLVGDGHRFNYDAFKVEMPKIDSIVLNIPRGDGAYDENNELILVPMNSKIEKVDGLLEIDHKLNKSGRSPLKQFPMLTSLKNSYVYYDQKRILNGVYPRKSFYFTNDPFKMDSLRIFDENAMSFAGVLTSSDIFPPFKEALIKMPDFSLGFNTKASMAGFSAYKDKGKYTGVLKLDLDGLKGTGQVEYLSSKLACSDITFFPDSMNTVADQFTIAKTATGVSTPVSSSTHNKIHWRPYQDEMSIARGDSAFKMYDDKTTFDGSLLLGTKGLYGNGTLEWDEASLASKRIKFQAEDLEADTANLQIKSKFGDRVTFITPNVHAKIDFKNKLGKFVSNVKDIPTDFAYNQYKTYINEFDWDMDKKILDFKSAKDSPGAYFISTKPEQNELKVLAKRGIYNLQTSILELLQVPEIIVADSRVIPDSNKVIIEPEAKMRTLTNAKIVGDTTKGYQKIDKVTLDITGLRSMSGTGTYTYKMKNTIEEKVKISEIKVNPITIGEGKEARTEYRVFAKGSIEEAEKFSIYPGISYKGGIEFYTKDKDVTMNGFAKLNYKNTKAKTDWFSINQQVDANKLNITYSTPKSPEGNSILAGIALNTRDSNGIYTLLMGSKSSRSDDNVFEAKGIIVQNEATGEYTYGDSARILGDAVEGNVMKYNDNTGAVTCDGKLGLGIDFGAIENLAAGTITTNINEDNKYKFDMTLALNLEFSKDMNEKIALLLETDFENGDLDVSTDKFAKQMTEMIDDKKDETKYFEELNKSGLSVKPKSLGYNLILSDLKFVFDPIDMTYKSIGPIGVLSYGEKSLEKKVDGYIEMGANRSSGYFNIYFKSSLGDWMFITYKSNNVTFLTSYDEVNGLVSAVEPDKRKVTRDNGKFYIFALGSQTKMKAFVEKMKAYALDHK